MVAENTENGAMLILLKADFIWAHNNDLHVKLVYPQGGTTSLGWTRYDDTVNNFL